MRDGQPLLNEANDRIEEYCATYIATTMKRFTVSRAYRYEPKRGTNFDTPDLIVKDSNRIVLAG